MATATDAYLLGGNERRVCYLILCNPHDPNPPHSKIDGSPPTAHFLVAGHHGGRGDAHGGWWQTAPRLLVHRLPVGLTCIVICLSLNLSRKIVG